MKLVESSAKEFYDKYKNEMKYASYFEHLMDVYNDEREDVKFYTCEKTTANSFYYFIAYSMDDNYKKNILVGSYNYLYNENIDEIFDALKDINVSGDVVVFSHNLEASLLMKGFTLLTAGPRDDVYIVADCEDTLTGEIKPERLEIEITEDGIEYYSANCEIDGTRREIVGEKYLSYGYSKTI